VNGELLVSNSQLYLQQLLATPVEGKPQGLVEVAQEARRLFIHENKGNKIK
jgi:hypothetical protein